MRPFPPTGISTQAYANSVTVKWRASTSSDIKGYNIYNSQTSGGGISGYAKLNDELIQTISEIVSETTSFTETVNESGGVRTTTTTEQLQTVYYYSFTHSSLKEEKQEFYVITSVNTSGQESLFSSEVNSTPLIIDISFVNTTKRTKADVDLALMDIIFNHNKEIDLKPGTMPRDLFIDPVGIEFSNAYILLNFYYIASSFVSLKLFDDSNSDRISDDVSTSSVKQDLRKALGYNTDGSEDYLVQLFIDSAFDKLAANSKTVRFGATKSRGEATFYTPNTPVDDITINAEEIISTVAGQNTPAINFKTLASITFIAKNASTYYNSISQQYELKVAIEALNAGIGGNKQANTIINTTIAGLKVTNEFSTYSGRQQESNADLADRAMLAYGPLDVGTLNGYERTVVGTQNVEDVIVIDAGHTLMQRDYDDVRRKHVFGKVDIYFQGEELEEFTENIGFLYNEVSDENFSIIALPTSLTNLTLQSSNPNVTTNKPIFQLSQVRNVTQGYDYDILGNVAVYVNGVMQEKGRFKDIEVNLTTGEVIFSQLLTPGLLVIANYDSYISNEIVLDIAAGGETTATLAKTDIRQESYNVYKNNTLLVEITDYSLNLTSGLITFVNPLSTADHITASYAYIILGEVLIASSLGGERVLTIANVPIYPSVTFSGNQVQINRFNTFNSIQTTLITDIIRSTYRYRDSDPIILINQPVRSISSISGSTSGLLIEGTHYTFDRNDDVLLNGNSTQAQRGFSITYNIADQLPSGSLHNFVENIILPGQEEVALTYKGTDISSILIQNTSRTSTYVQNIDFVIVDTGLNNFIKIRRINGGSITNGQTVLVDYNYGEVLTVKYVVNNLVLKLQTEINKERHITADVFVKESPTTKIDIAVNIILRSLADKAITKNAVISAITDEITQKHMGDDVFRSDIIRAIDSVSGVDYVILPMTKMVKANDTLVIREEIDKHKITWVEIPSTTQTWITSLKWINENPVSNGTFTITPLHSSIVNTNTTVLNRTTTETYSIIGFSTSTILLSGLIPPLSTDVLELTYFTRTNALTYPTTGNAANPTLPFGVFENDVALTLVDTESGVDSDISQAYIAPDGAILVSPKYISNPNGAQITVSYFIENQLGDNDILVSDIEHMEPGSIDVFIA